MKRFLLSCLLLCISVSLFAAKPEKLFEKKLQAYLKKYSGVGVCVGVVRDDRLVYTKAFGMSNAMTGQRMELSTVFKCASVSKSLSAVLVMQMVERGEISLKDDISTLLGYRVRNPKWPDTVITLEMLLSHRASLSDKRYLSTDIRELAEDNPKCEKHFLDCKPGTEYHYSNLGTNTVGAILELKTGVRYDRLVQERIFQPIGMEASFWADDFPEQRLAASHYLKDSEMRCTPGSYNFNRRLYEKYELGNHTRLFSPCGGMRTTVEGLVRYMKMLMHKGVAENGVRIISEESVEEIFRPRTRNGYGLCLGVRKMCGKKLYHGHFGHAAGYRTAMHFDPQTRCGVVVMTNGFLDSGDSHPDYRAEISDMLYESFLSGD